MAILISDMIINDVSFFDIRPHYKNLTTGSICTVLSNILEHPIHFNNREKIIKQVKIFHKRKNCNPIIFRDIYEIPYKDHQSETIGEMYKIRNPKKCKLMFFINGLIDSLYKTIQNTWDSNVFNVILHSSGYDSRIISWLIKKMANEQGINRLGLFKFVCYGKEGPYFKKIMNYERWSRKHYSILNLSSVKFDFLNCYKTLNGAMCTPVNSLGHIYNSVKKHILRKTNKKAILWTGRGFTEILNKYLAVEYDNLPKVCDKNIYGSRYAQASTFPIPTVFPVLSEYVFDFLSKNCTDIKRTQNRISKLICKRMDKNLVNLKRHVPKKVFVLNAESKRQIKKQYKSSRYGQYLNNKLSLNGNKDSGWVHWTCAGMIEDLKRG